MLVRATLTLRNEILIAKREALKLTQLQAADLVGCGISGYVMIERLDFSSPCALRAAEAASAVFEVPLFSIMPDSVVGEKISSKAVRVTDIEPANLLALANPQRFFLPSPADDAEVAEVHDALADAIDSRLTYREREIIKMRHGLGEDGKEHTYEEIGRIFKVTRERVRQVEAKAIRKLQDPRTDNPLSHFMPERTK